MGVDIEAGYKSVELMKKHIAKTMRPEVPEESGFSGAFSMEKFKDAEEPAACFRNRWMRNEGSEVAMVMDKHDTIGIDVAIIM